MIEYKRLAKERKKKRRTTFIGIVIGVICLLVGIYFLCTIRNVQVSGNQVHSAEEIERAILPGKLDYNTIYLWYRMRTNQIPTPPYLDLVEVEILSYNKIQIRVYEKTIIGCAEYNGSYVYFDKDGTVLDISTECKDGVTVVRGLEFDQAVLYQSVPVKEMSVFRTLVSLMQMLQKNSLQPNSIEFTLDQEIDMTFDEVLVHLGRDEHMDNKIARLTGILPNLVGRSGILFMEDVDEKTERISFRKTLSKAEQEQRAAEAAAAAEAENDTSEEWIEDDWSEDEDSGDDWSEDEGSGDDWSEDEDSGDDWSEDEGSGDDWSDDEDSEDEG